MEIPGKDFEVWFQVIAQNANWIAYEKLKNNQKLRLANPDSLYLNVAMAQATAFTGEHNLLAKNIPPEILSRYNADAGKSYLLNLMDLPTLKHYKYALLIVLQKNHTGTILAVCFTNEKNPEFYKNFDRASHCLKFKP
jgi:hypothetical protein